MVASFPEPRPVTQLELADVESGRFEREHVRAGRPALFRGAARDWTAVERWSDVAYLADAAGESAVRAVDPATGSADFVPLRTFWENAFAQDGLPFTSINATVQRRGQPGVVAPLGPDLSPVDWLADGAGPEVTKLFAGRDTRSGLHFHPDTDAFLCQIVGRKRVMLFGPGDSRNLYPVPWYSPYVCFSRVVFDRAGAWPDLDEFPRLAQTSPLECEVEPGDVLFLPIYWWHVVWGLGTAICATYFFRSPLRRRLLHPASLRANGLNRIGGLRLRLQSRSRGRAPGA